MMLTELKALALGFMNDMSGGDPVVRGLIGVWMLSVAGYLARSIPNKIKRWIYDMLTVSMTILREGDPKSQEFFLNFEDWFLKNNKLTARNLKTTTSELGDGVGFGYGSHLVFCEGRFYRIYKKQIEKAGDKMMTEQITVITYGRNDKTYSKIVDEAKKDNGRRYFWEQGRRFSSEPWSKSQLLVNGPKLFLEKRVEDQLRKILDFFLHNKEWYQKNGKPYRLNIVLYGPPGTGKTELIRWISDYLSADIFQCLISQLDTDRMANVTKGLGENRLAVLSLEDFEGIALSRDTKSLRSRYFDLKRSEDPADKELLKGDEFKGIDTIKDYESRHNGVGLSDFLNVLQGLRTIHNLVTVMSTNHIDWVDEAVLRGSRCNLKLYVGPLGLEQVKGKFEHQYEQPFPNYICDIKPIKACDLDALSSNNAFDADGFITGLIENYGVSDEETVEVQTVH